MNFSTQAKSARRFPITKVYAVSLAGWVMLAGTATSDTILFEPNQSGSVASPVVGLGEMGSDFLLAGDTGSATLPKDYSGNNQESFAFGNPSTAQDAAGVDGQNYMLQLSTGNDLIKVDTTTGFLCQ